MARKLETLGGAVLGAVVAVACAPKVDRNHANTDDYTFRVPFQATTGKIAICFSDKLETNIPPDNDIVLYDAYCPNKKANEDAFGSGEVNRDIDILRDVSHDRVLQYEITNQKKSYFDKGETPPPPFSGNR